MRKTLIDVKDVDYTWWEKVEAYQEAGRFHLPRHSVERLGEVDPDTGDALLIGGLVEAKAGSITVGGAEVPVWTVGAGQLVARTSRVGRRRA